MALLTWIAVDVATFVKLEERAMDRLDSKLVLSEHAV